MQPGSIIKDFNVFEAGSLHFSMGSVTQAMVPLIFKTVKPAFGRGVVPAITFATHRAGHAIFLERVLKGMAGVLAASVRMMHDARFWSTAKPGHPQSIRHNIGRHARLERPADHFPVEQIQNNGKVQPAFVGPQVRDVRRPDQIGGGWHEVPVQQIRCHWQTVLRICRDLVAPLVAGSDAVLTHEPLNALLACCKTAQPHSRTIRGLP